MNLSNEDRSEVLNTVLEYARMVALRKNKPTVFDSEIRDSCRSRTRRHIWRAKEVS